MSNAHMLGKNTSSFGEIVATATNSNPSLNARLLEVDQMSLLCAVMNGSASRFIVIFIAIMAFAVPCWAQNGNPSLSVGPGSSVSGDKYIGVWQDEVAGVHTLDVRADGQLKITISWPDWYATSSSRKTTKLTIKRTATDGDLQFSKTVGGPWSTELTWEGSEIDVTAQVATKILYTKGIKEGKVPILASFVGKDPSPPPAPSENWDPMEASDDKFEVFVYKLDVEFDGVVDADEEKKGGLLAVDRNTDEAEKESLKKCTFKLKGPSGSGKKGHLLLELPANLKAWKTQSVEPRTDAAAEEYTEAELLSGVTVWIEAKEPSTDLRDGKVKMYFGDDLNYPITLLSN